VLRDDEGAKLGTCRKISHADDLPLVE
jgi:hypothetical protein